MEWLSPVVIILDGTDHRVYCGRCYGRALLAQSTEAGLILEGYICEREGHALSSFAESKIRRQFDDRLREELVRPTLEHGS